MWRLGFVVGLLVGCSGPTAAPLVATSAAEHRVPAAAPSLVAPIIAPAAQVGLDEMEEQIQGQAMFCVDEGHDCPSGFRCDDGACVASP